MNLKLDKRLEGLPSKRITRKFVRDNATKEELSPQEAVQQTRHQQYFDINHHSSVEEKLEIFSIILDFCSENVAYEIDIGIDSDGIIVRFLKDSKVIENIEQVESRIRNDWKNKIQNYNKCNKEYEEYLRLHNKFSKPEEYE